MVEMFASPDLEVLPTETVLMSDDIPEVGAGTPPGTLEDIIAEIARETGAVMAEQIDLQLIQDVARLEVENALRALTPSANEVQIVATSVEGFQITLVARRAQAAEAIDALVKMQGWLVNAGFKGMGF